MRRTFKFQLRPTSRQAGSLVAMLKDHRDLYNAALQERRDAYAHPSRTRITYGDQSAQLKEIRAYDPDQARWSFSSQQATLRRLNLAFQAFFRRVTSGETPGYPRFKGAGRFDTVTWPVDNDGCTWDSQPEHPTQTFVRLQGVGHVKVNQHRRVRGTVKTVSVKREGRRWYVLLSCDGVPAEPLPTTGAVVGVDVGIASLATTSDGRHYGNPRLLERAAASAVGVVTTRRMSCSTSSTAVPDPDDAEAEEEVGEVAQGWHVRPDHGRDRQPEPSEHGTGEQGGAAQRQDDEQGRALQHVELRAGDRRGQSAVERPGETGETAGEGEHGQARADRADPERRARGWRVVERHESPTESWRQMLEARGPGDQANSRSPGLLLPAGTMRRHGSRAGRWIGAVRGRGTSRSASGETPRTGGRSGAAGPPPGEVRRRA